MKNAYIPIISLLLFVTFMLLTLQFRTINQSQTEITRLQTENELRDEINEWKDMYEAISYKNQELESRINEYKNSFSENDEKFQLLNDEITDLEVLSGLSAVTGKGIVVTLDDTRALNQIAADAGYYDPNVYVIHDSDILVLVNELKAAGCDAISINGQRIIANTEIRCVGPVIQINGIRLTAPFKISAIGAPDYLSSALKLRGGIIDQLSASNIDVTIEGQDSIIIPKYEKVIEYKYAIPYVEEEEDK